MLEKLYEMQGVQRVKMSVEQRKEAFFQQLDLSDLEGWSPKNWAATCTLLAEYHTIFSLEPGELGCTDLAKNEIKVADNEPFEERFWRIPGAQEGWMSALTFINWMWEPRKILTHSPR